MNHSRKFLLSLCLLGFSGALSAQFDSTHAARVDKSFAIPKLEETVKIGGLLDEAIWSQAAFASDKPCRTC